jgi:hypothetical protein
MKRCLFEFEDLSWFPSIIRESMTDFLRFFLKFTNFYDPITSVLAEGLSNTQETTILDLCSGGGGGIIKVYENLRLSGTQVDKIILSDKFPNLKAYQYLKENHQDFIDFIPQAIDAAEVPPYTKGFRVIFSAFHHFNPNYGKRVLKNAVSTGRGIAIFDGGDKNLLTMLSIIILVPVAFLLLTPFFRPFKFSRLIFTYLVPIIPLCTIWDGIVSITRFYTPDQLLQMSAEINAKNYRWKAGKLKNKFGMRVSFLLGYPMVSPIN